MILQVQNCSAGRNSMGCPLLPELLFVDIYHQQPTVLSLLKKEQELTVDVMFKCL